MTLRGVSSSDWHFDGGVARLFPLTALEKQMHEVDKVHHYCIERGVRHLFSPGDLSDKARISEATFIAIVAMWLKYDKHLSVHYIAGNHDFAQVGKTSLDVLKLFCDNSVFKNVHIYDTPKIVEIDGVDVAFMPYPALDVPKTKAGRPRLIFAHIEEVGAVGDNGVKLKASSLKLNRTPEDYTISGHLHTYQVLKSRRTVFNGSLYQKTFGESRPKGFIEFKARYRSDGRLSVNHEFVDNRPEFILENRVIETSADWDALETGEHIFYKITLGEGVVAPKDITREIPNIVNINGTSYKGRDVLETGEKMSVNDIPVITPLTGLVEYLHRYELSKREVRAAIGMVKEAMKTLGMEYK
jgi:hypothetical protein